MQISAVVTSSSSGYDATVATGGTSQSLAIPAKPLGPGSAVSGGEFLMLALATCYCNDLYREARRLGISLQGAQVEASAEFDGVGLAARNIQYKASVQSTASPRDIARLLRETDAVAEVHNTVRAGAPVQLLLA
ncbi:MAG TPA: OsmC family protein [Casimicrobiaceae bacterium]